MSNKVSIIALIIAIAALSVAWLRPSGGDVAKKETAFERVMRTRTIRCAYAIYPPFLMDDPKTGQKSGISYEVIEALAKAASLKVEWLELVGYGAFPDQLRAGKEDVFCSGAWTSVPRAQRVEYTGNVGFSTIYLFARDGDKRFDGNAQSANSANVTLSVIEGSTQEAVVNADFPKAKRYSLPEMTDNADAAIAVAINKADAVVFDPFIVNDYNAHNSRQKLRMVEGVPPLRTYGVVFAVAKGEWELRDLINVALTELQLNGTIDKIISKYETTPGAILRVAKPYASPVSK